MPAKFYLHPESKRPNFWPTDRVHYYSGRLYHCNQIKAKKVRILTSSEGKKRKKLYLEDHFQINPHDYDYPYYTVAAVHTKGQRRKKYPPKFLVFFQNSLDTQLNRWVLNKCTDLWHGSILVIKLGGSCSFSKGWDGPKCIQRKDISYWDDRDNKVADCIVKRLVDHERQTGKYRLPAVPSQMSVIVG